MQCMNYLLHFRTTLNRALAERIFLLLRKRDDNCGAAQWTFLQGPVEKSDKTLRSCAERIAKVLKWNAKKKARFRC